MEGGTGQVVDVLDAQGPAGEGLTDRDQVVDARTTFAFRRPPGRIDPGVPLEVIPQLVQVGGLTDELGQPDRAEEVVQQRGQRQGTQVGRQAPFAASGLAGEPGVGGFQGEVVLGQERLDLLRRRQSRRGLADQGVEPGIEALARLAQLIDRTGLDAVLVVAGHVDQQGRVVHAAGRVLQRQQKVHVAAAVGSHRRSHITGLVALDQSVHVPGVLPFAVQPDHQPVLADEGQHRLLDGVGHRPAHGSPPCWSAVRSNRGPAGGLPSRASFLRLRSRRLSSVSRISSARSG